jgi:glutaredoxin
MINPEDCYTCSHCKRDNSTLKDLNEQKNYFKQNDPKDVYG